MAAPAIIRRSDLARTLTSREVRVNEKLLSKSGMAGNGHPLSG